MKVAHMVQLLNRSCAHPTCLHMQMQHARIFSSHIELATAKLDAIRVFRSAAYDLRREELFAGL